MERDSPVEVEGRTQHRDRGVTYPWARQCSGRDSEPEEVVCRLSLSSRWGRTYFLLLCFPVWVCDGGVHECSSRQWRLWSLRLVSVGVVSVRESKAGVSVLETEWVSPRGREADRVTERSGDDGVTQGDGSQETGARMRGGLRRAVGLGRGRDGVERERLWV